MRNDEGVAYSFVMITVALIVLAGAWIVLIPFINGFVGGMNDQIDSGTASAQTVDAFQFNLTIFYYWPAFLLGAWFLFGIVRALYERRFPT